MDKEPVLKFDNATKRFGSFVAVDHVNFKIHNKEIVAIIGENGAGKSTFCKMLTGNYTADEGVLYLDGKQVNFQNTTESMKAGISMVYQERSLVGLLTGAQNICLGNEPTNNGLLSEKKINEHAVEIRDKLHLKTRLDIPVEELGAGEQQLIEIMRAFYIKPKVLILDEPTASLGEGEIEPFLSFVQEIREKMDIAIIFISHKIEEVFAICDSIVVLADGKNTLTNQIKNVTKTEVVSAMLRSGKAYGNVSVPEKDFSSLPVVLKVDKAFYDGKEHQLNFDVRRGEVVGFYGLVGAGRTECAEMLFGLRRGEKSFEFNGETITKNTPGEMIEKGMIVTPELRSNGIFKTLSLIDNICNLFLKKELAGRILGLINRKASLDWSQQILSQNDVKFSNVNQPILGLSGGNIQKIIIGRSISIKKILLLVLDEPTTGIDIGAKFEIYQKIRALTDCDDESKRVGILFISSELDEILNVCDRLFIFSGGDIVAEFNRKAFDKTQILHATLKGKAQ